MQREIKFEVIKGEFNYSHEEFECPYCNRSQEDSVPNPDGDHFCKCGNHQFN